MEILPFGRLVDMPITRKYTKKDFDEEIPVFVSQREFSLIAAIYKTGSHKLAAAELGITYGTEKVCMARLRARLKMETLHLIILFSKGVLYASSGLGNSNQGRRLVSTNVQIPKEFRPTYSTDGTNETSI